MAFNILKKGIFLALFILVSCQSKTSKYYDNLEIKEVSEIESKKKRERFSKLDANKELFAIASWNIRDLGRTKNPEEITSISKVIKDYDLILIQEIVGKDPAGIQAVAKIVDELNRLGSKWDYSVSNPTNSPSANMSERYGYLWKVNKATLKGKAYLDKDLEKLCYREPYIGTFVFKGRSESVTLVNYHSRKHNDKPEEEIIHLKDYKRRLGIDNIIISGDFNLNEKHPVWDNFYNNGFVNALENTSTTLKTKCKSGNYLNHSIDNIFSSDSIKVIKSGNIDFVKTCKNLNEARKLSDHLPVFIQFQ
ncbi:endonuclease/exonuclease/phosphatase family protein [Tenacibaculum maritimum]|uniref:endonuclease/exonuclease/phosphatase family protein n=1 Tax=Tenacibaculum maritimum TaxID=107401 RepID=UPI00388DF24E